MAVDSPHLVEREALIAEIGAMLTDLNRGSGWAALLEGVPGSGKSAMLRRARRLAASSGVQVLSARCGAFEQEFPFGVVRQLFRPVVEPGAATSHSQLLEGAARFAESVLVMPTWEPDRRSSDPLPAILHGLYWLSSNLSGNGPVLMTVDDFQWADGPSQQFLGFLLRRLDDLPVGLLVAGWAESEGDQMVLDEMASDNATRSMRVAPLTVAGTRVLLQTRLGVPVDERFAHACQRATGGNAFFLGELVRELTRLQLPPTAESVGDGARLVPDSITRSVLARLRRLPALALEVAAAVAVLGDEADLRHTSELANMDGAAVAGTVDSLVRAGILEPGRPLRFPHPIVAAAVRAGLPQGERSNLHRKAATLLQRDGAAASDIAPHLIASDPADDPAAVEIMRQAAAQALATGAPEAAARWLRRALIETSEDELRTDLLAELCIAEARMPHANALSLLRRGLEVTSDRRQRSQIALDLAHVIGMVADMDGSLELLAGAVDEVEAVDPDLALFLEAEYISVARLYPRTRPDALARLLVLRGHAVPEHLPGAVLLANLALQAVEAGEPADTAVEFARLALARNHLLAHERWVFAYAANTFTWADRFDQAERHWRAAFAEAARTGSTTMFILSAAWRSHLALRVGNVSDAESYAELATDVCQRNGWGFASAYATAFLVDAKVERGELQSACQALDRLAQPSTLHYLLHARGRLRCQQGRFEEGLADIQACGESLEYAGQGANPAVIAWRSSAAIALEATGCHDKALAMAEDEHALAQAFGAPRAIGVAQQNLAQLQTGEARLSGLASARRTFAQAGARLEEARALTALGSELRRRLRLDQAADCLRQALDLAHRCGANGLRNEIRNEMAAMGLRPRRFTNSGPDALTPGERRVAEMAAQGARNREIAEALFVSLKTVEAHLSSTYRKLSVANRLDLASALGPKPGSTD